MFQRSKRQYTQELYDDIITFARIELGKINNGRSAAHSYVNGTKEFMRPCYTTRARVQMITSPPWGKRSTAYS